MLLLSLATWPVFVAGIQILTAELSAGREARLFKLFPHILKLWPRVAMLCVFVYGVFFLLTVFAFGIAIMIIAAGSSLLVPFLALALLGLQVWMFGRFFINVLSGSSSPFSQTRSLRMHYVKAKNLRGVAVIFPGSNAPYGRVS